MFISKAEKTQIQEAIAGADLVVRQLTEIMRGLNERVGNIEEAINKGYIKPKKKPLTPEQKVKQREYVRAYHARKKAEKAQQVAA